MLDHPPIKIKSHGVLLIATGHPNYGKMAYNLALSIGAVEKTRISVVKHGDALSHLTDMQLCVFDKIIDLPEAIKPGFNVKLHLDQLTPYDQTLALDSDMLWLGKSPAELFTSLYGTPFTTITEGNSDAVNNKYYFWADQEEIKKAYGVDKVWQIRSEVIYFEKGTKVFSKARSLQPEKKLKTIRMFGEHIPDELYFNLATAILGINFTPWMPAYWARLHGEIMPNLSVLYRDYYLLSFGGNIASPVMKRAYDNVMQVASNKLGFPYLFKLKSKKEWAPGRLKI